MWRRLMDHMRDSLRGRLALAIIVAVTLMLIPAAASIGMMTRYARQYHDVITRMDKISSLSPVIRDDLLGEMWSIVAGRETFGEGGQFATLDQVCSEMEKLIAADSASRLQMTVARNTMNTLRRYIESLGEQMKSGSTVDDNEQTLAEIRDVGSLVVDMLGDAITAEIDATMAASNQLQRVVRYTLIVELCLLILTLAFARIAHHSLGRTIARPIEELKRFAGMIADGHLDVRAPDSGVSELSELTRSLNTMAAKLKELIEENTREQENLKKSEMRVLQAQIAPHFLYNTLDAIIWLAEARKALLMGAVIHYLNVPPFITTLTGMFLARGICSLISRESINKNASFDALAGWKLYVLKLSGGEWVRIKPIAFINFNVLLFLAMILIGAYILQRTRTGRNIYAIGGNEQSAKLMGLPVAHTKLFVYGFNGLCSALAGIAYALYIKNGWNLSLQGAELDVISSAVIGGTLLTGGVGYMFGTLLGVLLKSVIPAIITFNGNLLSWWGKIAIGALLLIFIGLQRIVVVTTGRRRKT